MAQVTESLLREFEWALKAGRLPPITSNEFEQLIYAHRRYHELLFAVGNKYTGETRHETVLRYIRQAEAAGQRAADSASRSEPQEDADG